MATTTCSIDVRATLPYTPESNTLYSSYNYDIITTTKSHSYTLSFHLIKYPTFPEVKKKMPKKPEYILRYNFAFTGIANDDCEELMEELVRVARKHYGETYVKGWREENGMKPAYAWAHEEGVEKGLTEVLIEVGK